MPDARFSARQPLTRLGQRATLMEFPKPSTLLLDATPGRRAPEPLPVKAVPGLVMAVDTLE